MARGVDRGGHRLLGMDPEGFMGGRQALVLRVGVRVVIRPICLLKPILLTCVAT